MAIPGSKPPATGSPPARHPLGSPAYRGVRGLIRLLLWLFYRRIDVVGRERIPETGPVIVAANHHNALVDAMLIMATIPRPITVLAKAPLFRHPLIGPPLWMIGAVPVHRRAESGDDPRRNDEMFAAAIEALRAGGVILIFPEGRSQPQPILMPLRTGAARLTEAITARIVEAEDQYSLELLRVLERAWLEEAARRGERELAGDAAEQALAWKQRVMRAGRYLAAREPHRIAELRHRIELYRSHLDEVGITSEQLGQPYTVGLVVSYVVRNALWLALGLPLALWGIVSHAAPYWLTGQIVKRLGRTEEEEATYKMAVGVVIYPVLWALEGWLIWRSAGRGTLIVFLLLIVPSGLLALLWRERLGRFIRQARAFVWFLADRDLHRRLLDERRALVAELSELADRVPPELLRSDRASDVG